MARPPKDFEDSGSRHCLSSKKIASGKNRIYLTSELLKIFRGFLTH